ncbi:tRNA glutamyl-Q(34) synthetase GluQRS [Acetobacter lambici]|uniref:tRNA glutamyl-Q(34) synthetase GluQRS n=1 Tax=Acetobacter lambici TaxID=1332824 RepID=A0ABT1F095_9PROT|nr:tRNA glutamyl-Q(34) synthetase GluQRS [Acetobacter lambici]MCP1242401.1 tRNA glutamyl-Q(34) synthetase GluQRS [Acetobacter lambici]MCP1258623.1 tRNA glutamyl-Q(34) synthetase GluQRS [Acetobacter lambici]NHO56881.1 tRNA glutamyl-Q(34) synthetase GluQRS [Acetobacter lambici]
MTIRLQYYEHCKTEWVTRFAPSPTGALHLGHVASALFGWELAQPDGQWLVRMEDIDPQRCKPAFASAIMEDLAWLGLVPDGPVLHQSARMAVYGNVLDTLEHMGVLYPCFCTRSDIARESAAMFSAPHTAPDGSVLYPGRCRHIGAPERLARMQAGQPYVLRLHMARAVEQARALVAAPNTAGAGVEGGAGWPLSYHDLAHGPRTCQPELFGDVVLARRDVPASYHLCVTCDDATQGVTLVTRGEDLRPATSLHRLLQTLMGWPAPHYAFHPLLCDATGRRLAKRDGALSVRTMRESGLSAAQVRAKAVFAAMPCGGAP